METLSKYRNYFVHGFVLVSIAIMIIAVGSIYRIQVGNACNDIAANNYNGSGSNDDCTYTSPPPSPIYGCTDLFATNYDGSATDDDGSCTYYCNEDIYVEYGQNVRCSTLKVFGCTDVTATNRNESANVDDGSCTYYCSDEAYTQYGQNVQCSTLVELGCTDVAALNYDASANTDDGSCSYDEDAPEISDMQASPGNTSVIVTWTTSEAASSRVSYGLTNTTVTTNTSVTDTSPMVTSHSRTITGLSACTKYYYRVTSYDSRNNTTNSGIEDFTTTGCVASSAVVSTVIAPITKTSGGTFSSLSGNTGVALEIPDDFHETDATFQIQKLSTPTIKSSVNFAAGVNMIGDYTYELVSLSGVASRVTTFDNPITVTISYQESDIVGFDESTLAIYRYDGSAWHKLSNCSINASTNTVSCTTTQFSVFTLGGATKTITSPGSAPLTRSDIGSDTSGSKIATSTVPISQNIQTKVPTFARTLKLGMKGEDVKQLQKYLNYKLFFVSHIGPGSPGEETEFFGLATRNALIRFQNYHAPFILRPLGLTRGTGMLGSSTIGFIEKDIN